MDFSVIVCTYNPKIDDLKFTLDSIVEQTESNYEIVISDDGSKDNIKYFYEDYFRQKNFKNYKLRLDKENRGTVVNIIKGLELASGKYIHTIGQGDAFTDKYVLRDVYSYMEENSAECVFTRMSLFEWREGRMKRVAKSIPRLLKPWRNNDTYKICENIIVFNDQISGASVFFKKKYSENMMNTMKISTKYMEDLFQYISVLNHDRILFFDRECIFYEYGGGISTSTNLSSRNKMRNDKNSFLNYLYKNFGTNEMVLRRKQLEKIEASHSNKIIKIIKKIIAEPKWIFFRIIR